MSMSIVVIGFDPVATAPGTDSINPTDKSTTDMRGGLVRELRLIENVKVAPKLSIVVPAFNEAARLGGSLKQIVRYLSERREQTELIVVDDGSTDNTAVVAEEALRDAGAVATRVIRYEENRGKGYAVRLGLLQAQAN